MKLILNILLTGFFLCVLCVRQGKAQNPENGIRFGEKNWESMLSDARENNRLIFLDAYAVWCGPCKLMKKNVFTDPAVGALFNRNFINAEIDMEKGEGITIKNKYDIRFYPTFLFINGNGEVVHQVVGSSDTAAFMEHALNALSPRNNLRYLRQQYEAGAPVAAAYLAALKNAYQNEEAGAVAQKHLAAQDTTQWLEKENWRVIEEYVTDAVSAPFRFLVKHRKDFALAFGKDAVEDKIYKTLLAAPQSYITYYPDKAAELDARGFSEFIHVVATSGYDKKEEIIAKAELNIFFSLKNWDGYTHAVNGMLEKNLIPNDEKGKAELYGYADNVHRFAENNETALLRAVDWCALLQGEMKSASERNQALHADLYANLLEKTGQKKLAASVRKNIDQEKLQNTKNGMPFQPMRIIPKQ